VKVLKKILLVLVILVIVMVAIGFFLPSRYRVERSATMNAKPDAVFTHINTLKKWPEWTAWTVQRFPDMKLAYEGPDAGTGASYRWTGKTSGDGQLKITRSEPDKVVAYDLDFDHGKYLSTGTITLEPAGSAVKVTWVNEGDLGNNPINHWFGLLMDKMMGPDMETGLNNLKAKIEAKP
jgi:hypothetical protein